MKIKKFNENKNNNAKYFLAGDIKEFIREINDEYPFIEFRNIAICLTNNMISYNSLSKIFFTDDLNKIEYDLPTHNIKNFYNLFDDIKIFYLDIRISKKNVEFDKIKNLLTKMKNHINNIGADIILYVKNFNNHYYCIRFLVKGYSKKIDSEITKIII